MRLALIGLLTILGGCDLYFGHGPNNVEDDVCLPATTQPNPNISLRDPTTGACDPVEVDCGCGGCGVDIENTPECNGVCQGLDESTCLATSGCHGTYNDAGTFGGCWDIAPATPEEGGNCANLDAATCALHDDCVSVFGTDTYERCAPEAKLSCATVDCGPGSQCEDQCAPCNSAGCQTQCSPVCVPTTCDLPCPTDQACTVTCTGGSCIEACEPTGACDTLTTESECTARADCAPIYDGMDCTCTVAGGCTCASETFARCTTGGQ